MVNHPSDNLDTLLFLDEIFFEETGKHLDTLQQKIIKGVLSRQKYSDIAEEYKCSIYRVKEVAADLWRVISKLLGEKVNKNNLESAIERRGIASFGKSIQINQISNLVANGICLGGSSHSDGHSLAQEAQGISFNLKDSDLKTLVNRMIQEGLNVEQVIRVMGIPNDIINSLIDR